MLSEYAWKGGTLGDRAKMSMTPENNRFDRTVLLILIVLEALLFSSFYMREVAWYPPDNFDQASYLIETYRLQERILTHGLGQAWKVLWSRGHAAGAVFSRSKALWQVLLSAGRGCRNCACSLLDSADSKSPLSRRREPFGSGACMDTSLSV